MKEILSAFIAVILLWVAVEGTDPVVKTPLGELRGHRMTSRGGREFMAFSGVPYAEPPVGQLAFEESRPLKPWAGVKDAKENGPWCIQYMFQPKPKVIGQQDCLYLSVYSHNMSGKAPVLVHFHGGGFLTGNGADKTGPQYFMDEDVVIVDVNYRVGIFGFLSFEDKDLPGNQGMKDQVQSLRWVQQNIASFGGDPNRVTLVGESAGARSIYHHIVSPLTHGLFHAAIAESGTSYGLWSVAPEGFSRNLSMVLIKALNCTYTNTKDTVACLRSKDPDIVAAKVEIFRVWQVDPKYTFFPVLEPAGPDAFLVGPISEWQHKPVPLLMGTTSAEGLVRTKYFFSYNMSYEWYNNNFDKVAPISLLYSAYTSNSRSVTEAVKKFYFESGEITENDWRNLTTMYSDSWYTVGIMDGANKHSGDVYFYYFDYVGEKSFGGNADTRNDSVIFGAYHIDEIIYIWWNQNFADLRGEDLDLSKKLVKAWTDFAKYGNPDPAGKNWAKWTPDRHRYLHISNEGFNMEEGLAEDRYCFWKSIPPYRDNYI